MRRRGALALVAAGMASTVVSACLPAPAANGGNRIITSPTPTPEDAALMPRNWKTSTVKIGNGVNALTSLHFVQDLLVPKARIPFLRSLTFYAPRESPIVTIGLYYERNDNNRAARDLLTGSAFGLQAITDRDWPMTYQADQVKTVQSEGVTPEQLSWFSQQRQAIVDAMKYSPEGELLGRTYDCDFATRARPPANTPAALIVAGGEYAGIRVPFTVIAQTLVFSE
jgi:hypothetical protein